MSKYNPFVTGYYNGRPVMAVDAQSRIEMVKNFNLKQCLAAMQVKGLQKTVMKAIERRMAKLQKNKQCPRQSGEIEKEEDRHEI